LPRMHRFSMICIGEEVDNWFGGLFGMHSGSRLQYLPPWWRSPPLQPPPIRAVMPRK
jgi:hypothetical protein